MLSPIGHRIIKLDFLIQKNEQGERMEHIPEISQGLKSIQKIIPT